MAERRKFEIKDARGGAAFTVKVVTRAEQVEVAGIQDDGTLKIRLTAQSAGDPAANEELIRYLAGRLGVEEKRIEIVAGQNLRDKLISVEGVTTADIETKLGVLSE